MDFDPKSPFKTLAYDEQFPREMDFDPKSSFENLAYDEQFPREVDFDPKSSFKNLAHGPGRFSWGRPKSDMTPMTLTPVEKDCDLEVS